MATGVLLHESGWVMGLKVLILDVRYMSVYLSGPVLEGSKSCGLREKRCIVIAMNGTS